MLHLAGSFSKWSSLEWSSSENDKTDLNSKLEGWPVLSSPDASSKLPRVLFVFFNRPTLLQFRRTREYQLAGCSTLIFCLTLKEDSSCLFDIIVLINFKEKLTVFCLVGHCVHGGETLTTMCKLGINIVAILRNSKQLKWKLWIVFFLIMLTHVSVSLITVSKLFTILKS